MKAVRLTKIHTLTWSLPLIVCVTVLAVLPVIPFKSADSQHYIALAEGRHTDVAMPFAQRIFYSFTISIISKFTGLSIDQGFFVMGLAALIGLCTGIAWLLRKNGVAAGTILAVLATPIPIILFREYFLPDLFYQALLVLFFIFLWRKQYALAIVLCFTLQITRESTIVLSLLAFGLGVYKRSYWFALGIALATLVGMLMPSLIVGDGTNNIHQLNMLTYLSLKVPYNALRNLFAIEVWTDTLNANRFGNEGMFAAPVWTVDVPAGINLGRVKQIGINSFLWWYPFRTITFLLATFGIMPLLLFRELKQRSQKQVQDAPLWLLLVIAYGWTSLIIAPLLGASVGRLAIYGWPTFWLALPILIRHSHAVSEAKWQLLAIHLVLCWIPWLLLSWFDPNWMYILTAALSLAGWYGARYLLDQGKEDEPTIELNNRWSLLSMFRPKKISHAKARSR